MILDIKKENVKNIVEIEVTAEPNQSFDCYINDNHFYFTLRTNTSDESFLDIKLNDKLICKGANVNLANYNLAYASDFKQGLFFFWHNINANIEKYNFSHFGKNLRLYYGNI